MAIRVGTISGDYVQGSFNLLDLSRDRVRAALHFADLLGTISSKGEMPKARWYMRAALSEFKSIFDLLNADFKELGLAAKWKCNSHREALEADVVVAVLRKVRDLAIHSSKVTGEAKTFSVSSTINGKTVSRPMPAMVVDLISREALRASRKRSALEISAEELADFNDLARRWPADLLIRIAVYRSSQKIAAFLKEAAPSSRTTRRNPASQVGS